MKRSSVPAALFVLLAAAFSAAPASAIPTNYLFSFGTLGSGDGQFNQPTDLALGPNGEIYVMDWGNQRIQKFDADGNYLLKWGPSNGFSNYESIATSPAGNVYVHAVAQHQVLTYSPIGTFIRSWTSVGASGQLVELSCDAAGAIYITQWVNGAGNARKVDEFGGSLNYSVGEGNQIGGTIADANGNVFYVGYSPTGPRIYKRSNTTARVTDWSATGGRLGVSLGGDIYAPERLGNVVRIYDNNGTLVQSFGSPGSGPGEFNFPNQVVVGPDARIYVVDQKNHRIQVFGNGSVPAMPATWGRIKAEYRD